MDRSSERAGELNRQLQEAAYTGVVQKMQEALEKGADINATGGAFGSALEAAIAGGSVHAVEFLLEKDVDLANVPRFCMPW